jgi:hypothetical protein
VLYPILRRQSVGLALGYVTLRVVESTIITVGVVSLIAVVTLRQDLADGATDRASLILTGRSLVAVHDATFLLGPAFCAAIGNGLMLGYLMLRSGARAAAIRPVRHGCRVARAAYGPPRPCSAPTNRPLGRRAS